MTKDLVLDLKQMIRVIIGLYSLYAARGQEMLSFRSWVRLPSRSVRPLIASLAEAQTERPPGGGLADLMAMQIRRREAQAHSASDDTP